MANKLKVRYLKVKSIPHGIYEWKVTFKRSHHRIRISNSNTEHANLVKSFLKKSVQGKYRIFYEQFHSYYKKAGKGYKSKYRRVYTYILLENSMDVALLKLNSLDHLDKIYKYIKNDTIPSPQEDI